MVSDYLQNLHKTIVTGSNKNFLLLPIKIILYLFSLPLAIANTTRAFLFNSGMIKSYQSKLKIISVGNLSVGGTGKTPFCIMLLHLLLNQGKTPSLISRGYGKDESIIYQERFPQLKLIFNPDRVSSVKQLEQADNQNQVIVLDDAYQHQRIKRDKNILLIDATNPFGYGYFMPRGLLRESPKAANRADAIVFTHAEENKFEEYKKLVLPYAKPKCLFFSASHQIHKIQNNHGNILNLSETKNKKIMLVSGIANPDKFEVTLSNALIPFEHHIKFGDHHTYQKTDFDRINQESKNFDYILTTEKDIVKFEPTWRNNAKVYTVYIQLELHQKEPFASYILS